MDIDVGEFILSIRLNASLRNPTPPADEAEEKARHDLSTLMVNARPKIEKLALVGLMSEMGWDEERITKAQDEMARQQEEAKATEEKGRAEKNVARRRARL